MFLFELLTPIVEIEAGDLLLPAAATVLIAAAYIYKRNKRRTLQRRLKYRICQSIKVRLGPECKPEPIGYGNTGCVFACAPDDPILQQIKFLWKSAEQCPSRIAIKFAAFPDPIEQADLLIEIAVKLEQEKLRGTSLAMCPFLAIGLFHGKSAEEAFVVEVMPLIEGQSLRRFLKTTSVDSPSVIEELSGLVRSMEFLEQNGFFSRSIDPDNVIVTPQGHWIRIDFDRVSRQSTFPAPRMRRLSELTLKLMKTNPDLIHAARTTGFLNRLAATIRRDRKIDAEAAIMAPTDFIQELAGLQSLVSSAKRRN